MISALALLRNTDDVQSEIDELLAETKNSSKSSEDTITIIGLFKTRECQTAIWTSIVLHVTQQLSGINAVSKLV